MYTLRLSYIQLLSGYSGSSVALLSNIAMETVHWWPHCHGNTDIQYVHDNINMGNIIRFKVAWVSELVSDRIG